MKINKIIYIAIIATLINSCTREPITDPSAISSTLDFSTFEVFGNALENQIAAGDGAGIDNSFRNSGVVIDETDGTYFAVNGVHPVNSGDYTSYYPKSIVKASLQTDEIVRAYSFSSINGHEIDMEALSFGPEEGYLYIGDEYNYIYKLNLESGEIEQEWDLAKIGVLTSTDKGIEAITYSKVTNEFYVGIQDYESVIALTLHSNGDMTRGDEFAVGESPSGLFAHEDGSIYVLTFSSILRFNTSGANTCTVSIPEGLGMTRPDGIYIDSSNEYIYIADSQGPINGGYSMYKILWTQPCD